jgi:hypothetical protein
VPQRLRRQGVEFERLILLRSPQILNKSQLNRISRSGMMIGMVIHTPPVDEDKAAPLITPREYLQRTGRFRN